MRWIVLVLALVGNAHALLLNRGGGLLYDTVLDITWTQSAGMANSDWSTVNDWAQNLVYAGYSDWRLPWGSVQDKEQSFGILNCLSVPEASCRDNEMGYMYYYNLLGGSLAATLAAGITDLDGRYWSGTKRVETAMWYFDFSSGTQNFMAGGVTLNAWAVRDGDVAAVPIAGVLALLAVGVAGLAGTRVLPGRHPENPDAPRLSS